MKNSEYCSYISYTAGALRIARAYLKKRFIHPQKYHFADCEWIVIDSVLAPYGITHTSDISHQHAKRICEKMSIQRKVLLAVVSLSVYAAVKNREAYPVDVFCNREGGYRTRYHWDDRNYILAATPEDIDNLPHIIYNPEAIASPMSEVVSINTAMRYTAYLLRNILDESSVDITGFTGFAEKQSTVRRS